MIIIYEPDLREFADLLAHDLDCKTLELNIEKFSNGEFKINPIVADDPHAFVIFSKGNDLNSQLLKFFLILGNLKNFETIDIFMPYIPYSRQDSSVAFQMILKTLKDLNVRKIITIDIHKDASNPMIVNILPHQLFGKKIKDQNVVIVAPDNGAIPRGRAFAEYLQTDLITIDKVSGKVQNLEFAKDRNCLIVDDIVDSGKTLKSAEKLLKLAGAISISSCISDYVRNNLVEFHEEISSNFSHFSKFHVS